MPDLTVTVNAEMQRNLLALFRAQGTVIALAEENERGEVDYEDYEDAKLEVGDGAMDLLVTLFPTLVRESGLTP